MLSVMSFEVGTSYVQCPERSLYGRQCSLLLQRFCKPLYVHLDLVPGLSRTSTYIHRKMCTQTRVVMSTAHFRVRAVIRVFVSVVRPHQVWSYHVHKRVGGRPTTDTNGQTAQVQTWAVPIGAVFACAFSRNRRYISTFTSTQEVYKYVTSSSLAYLQSATL